MTTRSHLDPQRHAEVDHRDGDVQLRDRGQGGVPRWIAALEDLLRLDIQPRLELASAMPTAPPRSELEQQRQAEID